MNRPFFFFIVFLSILMIAQRSPAPIVEENPTPAPEEPVSKTKHSRKPKSSNQQGEGGEITQTRKSAIKSSPAAQSKFAGTWVGTMATVPWGNLSSVVTIDPTETAMAMSWYDADDAGNGKIHQHFKPSPPGERGHAGTAYAQAQIEGDTITASFPAPLLGKSTWSLTPQPDGVTANARMQAFMNNFTAIFHRSGSGASIPQTAPTAAARSANEAPVAKPVPNKAGFVYNPFAGNSQFLLDVKGKPSGTKVIDPKSGKTFVVP